MVLKLEIRILRKKNWHIDMHFEPILSIEAEIYGESSIKRHWANRVILK